MKVGARDVGRFVAAPPAEIRAVLVYGPDGGLVSERVLSLIRAVAGSEKDPFRAAEISAAALKNDPALLADEGAALSLSGGRRAVRMVDATDSLASVFAAWLDDAKGDSLVVAEAGALTPRSALRKLFESAAGAAAIACYPDEDRGLDQIIAETLKQHGLTASPEARAYLGENLGSDRLVTRSELEKLALYVGKAKTVTVEDAMAAVGDNAAASVDAVCMTTASGDSAGLDRALVRALQDGNHPVRLVRAVMRHFQRLHLAAGLMAQGKTAEQAVAALKPPVNFRYTGAVRSQLRAWPPDRLATALTLLTDAEIDCKTSGPPPEAVAGRVFLRLAQAAGRGRRGT